MTTNPLEGTGPGDVLHLVRRGQCSTRQDIQSATGLSRVTVGQRVEALLGAGLLKEGGRGESTGGRRPLQLVFDEDAGVVLAMALNTRHTTIGVLTLGGALLLSEEVHVEISGDPEHTLDTLCDSLARLLRRAGRKKADVVGLGVSVPGPVDPRNSRLNEPPIMTGWDGFDIQGQVQRRFAVPVVVENDANCMAMGELTAHYPDCPALVFLKVSTGIGAGIALGGKIWPGYDGGAGDIGHMRVTTGPNAKICRCGATGCLAATASGGALAAELRALGHADIHSARDVAALIRAGDPEAIAMVAEAGTRIGEVMAAVVCVLNPQTVVIGGDLATNALLSAVISSMVPGSMPRATRNMRVRLSTLGEAAALVGLTTLVVDDVYSPARINAALARPA